MIMYTKVVAGKIETVSLESFYPGLQLLSVFTKNSAGRDSAAVRVIKDGEKAGALGLDIFSDMLKMHTLAISPDFRGRGICKAVLNYLFAYAAEQGKSYLTFATENYAVLRIMQTGHFANTYYIQDEPNYADTAKYRSSSRWRLLKSHNILQENTKLTVIFDSAPNKIIFHKNTSGRWESREPYTLYTDSLALRVVHNANPEARLNAQFYISPFYVLKLPVRRP